MIPGINPNDLKRVMKQMGMKKIEAVEVIIKTPEKEIIVEEPEVIRMNLMGKDAFQISGNIIEREPKSEISEEDVKIVIEKTKTSKEKAKQALEESNGDIAEAILLIENHK